MSRVVLANGGMGAYVSNLLALWIRGDVGGASLWNALLRRPLVVAGKRRAFVMDFEPRKAGLAQRTPARPLLSRFAARCMRRLSSLPARGEARSRADRICTQTAYGQVFDLREIREARSPGDRRR